MAEFDKTGGTNYDNHGHPIYPGVSPQPKPPVEGAEADVLSDEHLASCREFGQSILEHHQEWIEEFGPPIPPAGPPAEHTPDMP